MPKGAYPHTHVRHKVYDPVTVEKVRKLYHRGRTQVEIADLLKLTQKIIWRLMLRHGIKAKIAVKRDQHREKNNAWRGDAAGYQALHVRVKVARGNPSYCENCKTDDPHKTYDWANLTGRYQDVYDYRRLCRSCHRRLDEPHKNSSKE